MDRKKKWITMLILCMTLVLPVFYGSACDSDYQDQEYEEEVHDEDWADEDEEYVDGNGEDIEVDEKGVPTEEGQRQITEQEQKKAMEEWEKEMLKEGEEAYKEDLANEPVDVPEPNRRGW